MTQVMVDAERDAFIGRMVQAIQGTLDIAAMYLGVRLGLYRTLAADGPATSIEIARRTHFHERYLREWLEQQTVSGVLHVENPDADPMSRRYSLPAGHAEVLLDSDSLNFLGPYPSQLIGTLRPLDAVAQAFRDGGGVPYEAYGADCRDGIAAGNRVQFINLLGTEWFPGVAGLHQRLRADPPARVADIGCGFGWSAISIARAYPKVQVDAFDLDPSSIQAAERNASAAGVERRVRFTLQDAAALDAHEAYDLVVAFETVHDMARPVEALAVMRRLVRPDGFVIVADEKVGESFDPRAGDIERLYYGFSLLHCLPASMASSPSAATGTVMRPSTMRRYAREAGFREIEILPIDHDFWRFYRLIG